MTLTVIGEIHQAANKLGVPVFVVGAVARIILLENIYGLKAGRATTDVDFAFALDNWEQFDALKRLLLENPRFRTSEHVTHRLYFQAPELEHVYKVDLIPFGKVEIRPSTIVWPPDMTIMMNVAGFSNAFAATVTDLRHWVSSVTRVCYSGRYRCWLTCTHRTYVRPLLML